MRQSYYPFPRLGDHARHDVDPAVHRMGHAPHAGHPSGTLHMGTAAGAIEGTIVGLLRPPNVERYARIGNIDKLTEAARSKRWPAAAAEARGALQTHMDLIVDTLGDKNMRKVLVAREALKAIGRPATKALLEKIDDPVKERRQDAVHALGEMRDPYAVRALVARLHDSDGLVRQLTCRALAKIADPRALAPLRRVTTADPQESVRKTAADAVRRLEKLSRVAGARDASSA